MTYLGPSYGLFLRVDIYAADGRIPFNYGTLSFIVLIIKAYDLTLFCIRLIQFTYPQNLLGFVLTLYSSRLIHISNTFFPLSFP